MDNPANKKYKNRAGCKPPRTWLLLLRFLINHKRPDSVLGDYEEQYREIVREKGVLYAGTWFGVQVAAAVPVFFRNSFYWGMVMFRSYVRTAVRNIVREKAYSFINIAGLAAGLACCMLIFLYIADELSYDRFHAHADEIYRAAFNARIGEKPIDSGSTPGPLGPALVRDFPEAVGFTRLAGAPKALIMCDEKKFYETGILFAENSFFDIFSFNLTGGDPETVLTRPNEVILTGEAAQKYFGAADPLGRTLRFNNIIDLTVTGIVEKPPANSHFTFNMLFSMPTYAALRPTEMDTWMSANFYTYLLLNEETDYRQFEAKLPAFRDKYIGEFLSRSGSEMDFFLQPLTDIHLHSHLQFDLSGNSDIRYVYAFSAIALFILLMACINFMNLSTARSAHRAREIGVRKVFGAYRMQIATQFIGESLVISVIALAAALVLVKTSLPYFNGLAGKNIYLGLGSALFVMAQIAALLVFTGIAAGSYPAVVMSGFSPVGALKGAVTGGAKSARFRRMLVIFQFAVSIALIAGTTAIFKQLDYMKNRNLGFRKEQMLVLPFYDDAIRQRIESIKNEMTAIDGVAGAAASMTVPGEGFNTTSVLPEGFARDRLVLVEQFETDADFLDTYEIEIVSGRGFSEEMTTDAEQAIMINETMAERAGWENPVGKKVILNMETGYYRTVIGIIRDFHHKSLYQAIEPTCITCESDEFVRLTLKLDTENIGDTMRRIEEKWKVIDPQRPFEYFFLDERFDSRYRAEERLGAVFRLFTLLAVLIGCLGLFGLISFTAEQRTKEIGIRKALGASVPNIVGLVSREFVVPVVTANIIAWPAAYVFVNRWLEGFAYRVDAGWPLFVQSGALALVIAFLTVSFRSFRAARANPADTLRHE